MVERMEPLWSCEDEDEARGLVTVLERAGILVALRDRAGTLAVDVAPADESKARALLARIAGVHARRLDVDRDSRRHARERWFGHAAWLGAGIAALVWLALALP
jgi:hypothetical protein